MSPHVNKQSMWIGVIVVLMVIYHLYFSGTKTDITGIEYNSRAYSELVSEKLHTGIGSPGYTNEDIYRISRNFQETCNPRKALPVTGLPQLPFEQAIKELIRRDREKKWDEVDCPREPKASPVSLKRVVGLVSFPGSGNTWTRHLLQQLTGIIAGDLKDIYRQKNVLTIKTHEAALWNQGNRIFDRFILIIRSPYDANVAEFKRGYLSLGKTGDIVLDQDNLRWNSYARKHMVQYWPFFLRVALVHREPIHFIFYEDMVKNLLPELVSIAVFLNTTHVDRFSFCCAISEREGTYHRNATIKDNSYLYSDDIRRQMNAILRELANDYRSRYPILARKLEEYQLF